MAAIFLTQLSKPLTIFTSPVSTTVDLNHELTFSCGVTVYGGPPKNDGAQLTFTKMVNVYFNIWFIPEE